MGLVGVNLPQFAFSTWKDMRACLKIARLREDMGMMASLLQKTSSTIDALRVRLLSTRIYGMARRKILEAWLYVVTRAKRHVRNTMQEMDGISPSSITSFSPAALQDVDVTRLPLALTMSHGTKSTPLQRFQSAMQTSPAQRVAMTPGSSSVQLRVETNRRKAVPVLPMAV